MNPKTKHRKVGERVGLKVMGVCCYVGNSLKMSAPLYSATVGRLNPSVASNWQDFSGSGLQSRNPPSRL